ncbi:MAG: flagellin [Pseudobdellovibrionaceae bacterium]
MPVVATNTAANTAILYLNKNSDAQSKSLAKLSSGSNIVSASDDASGLAVATTLQSDISVLNQAATNTQQAQSVLETVDGALSNIADILQRMKSLAAQSQSGSVDDASRAYIDAEYQQLISEIDGIVTSTTFNNTALLDGSYNQDYLVGTDAAADIISVDLSTVDASTTGLGIAAAVDTSANAVTASGELDAAIDLVSSMRSLVGALESRFSFRGDVIDTSIENLEAAKSAIVDVDIATEQSNYTTQQVLTEVATAALAQANEMKSSLLSLVK